MRLRALHRIEGKEVTPPGGEFNVDDAKAAQRLIDIGAAVEVADPRDDITLVGSGAGKAADKPTSKATSKAGGK